MGCKCEPFKQALDCGVHPSRLAAVQSMSREQFDREFESNRDPGDESDAA
jgi:hypothetical protein